MSRHRFHLNVTERCNIRCIHCYWEEYGKNPDPSLDSIEKILCEFKHLAGSYYEEGLHMLTLGGGEPTVRNDLEDIVGLSVRRGFQVRLITNAVLLDRERACGLKSAGVQVAQVSLDGATEATHDGVRGKGNWRRTMRGIEALKRARILTVLSYVLLPEINMEEAPMLLELARELRVAGVKFARPVNEGQARANRLQIAGDYWATYRRILAHAGEIGYKRLLLFFDPLAHYLRIAVKPKTRGLWGLTTDLCQCNNTELVEVNGSSGDVYYCRVRAKLGNLWEQDLAELWHHHPMLTALRRKLPEGACSECGAWSGCRGGCPAVVHGNSGELMLQDADCPEIQKQPSLYAFPANGNSNARVRSTEQQLRAVGRAVRDRLYSITLR